VPGVHPAEQRLDETVDELVAQAPGHQVADGHVVADGRRELVPRADQTLAAEHAARGQLVEVERDPHQRARQRPQRAARPHGRRGRRRVHDLRADLAGQRQALGTTRQHGLGTDVDGQPRDLGAAQLAADPRGSLEQQDVATRRGEPPGRDQTGDPATHDDHVPHVVSLGCAVWTPT
jgi:hypothetical protein